MSSIPTFKTQSKTESKSFKHIAGKWCLTQLGWNKIQGGYCRAPKPMEILTKSQLNRARVLWENDYEGEKPPF